MSVLQPELFDDPSFEKDALSYFSDASAEERGAIHTKPEVAAFVLDLVGWTADTDLVNQRLLEPSVGEGDFLLPAVERLLLRSKPNDFAIAPCVRAVEVNSAAMDECRRRLGAILQEHGWSETNTERLLDGWLIHADFLTVPLDGNITHIVGNPPYLRLESLPKDLLRLYRKRWRSLFDRADLYVAFFEKSLGLLAENGRLGFICADRWMKNRYGGPLREIIARSYHVEAYVDFTGCPAFFDEVDAYPAVTCIRRGRGKATRTAFRPKIDSVTLQRLSKALRGEVDLPQVSTRKHLTDGDRPWSFDEFGSIELLQRLEKTLPNLETVGAKVGIGVATGADAIFIGTDLDVEASRKLPLVTTRDIRSGMVKWSGKWVLNPFEEDGSVASLDDYPRFAAYIERHRSRIASRNVATRSGYGWYRTIDKIHAQLTYQPKLLIPDIKGSAHVVFEPGKLYPHHNLYYVVSTNWDLRALQTVLSSRVALAFVAAYSPRMRGGNLRFQAQYLRRIRLPAWESVSEEIRGMLKSAAVDADPSLGDVAVKLLYELTDDEWLSLQHGTESSENSAEAAA